MHRIHGLRVGGVGLGDDGAQGMGGLCGREGEGRLLVVASAEAMNPGQR
ncbi:hypothetical protein [Streptomyces sp. C10]